MAEIVDEYIRKNALIDFLVDMSTLEMYADVEEGIRLCIRWIKSIPPVHVQYVPDADVWKSVTNQNRLLETQAEMISPYNLNYDPENGLTTNRKLTNADRLRHSTEEEATSFLLEILDLIWKGATKKPMPKERREEYRKLFLDWLKSPVEESE